MGSAVKNAISTALTASMPNHLGAATTLANVSFGAVMMPIKRASKPFEAGAEPAAAAVVFIRGDLESS
jgi:hypothetical protein